MPAQMIPPTKDELMAFVPKMNEANQEEMRALLADPEFKALSENEQAEASIQALLFAYFTEQRFKDEADEADEDDDDDSVCFRVPHDYNEKECSDNCPYKPEEEQDDEEDCDYHPGRENPHCPECRKIDSA